MKPINAASLYKNTDQMEVAQSDANSILIKCFDELIKSVKIFQNNIVPNSESFRKKSSSFSRALTILYTLQSSVDFERDFNIAKNLFQVYEYTRVTLIEEFKSCKVNKSMNALTALIEIRDSWKTIS
jgi:flagellar protein FliS